MPTQKQFNKLLSIIIPTYNMDKYLTKCLDSLVNSSKVLPLMEILVINDGSKDNSSEIAHKYQKLYPYSVFVIDKENGNYGSCVNRGLKEATGKYIKILDADDYFMTQNLEEFIDILANNDVDLVLTNFDIVNLKGEVINKVRFKFPPNEVLNIEHICNKPEFTNMWMHAVTYRTAMVREINYHQSEGISYTDVEWIFEPMSYVKSVYYSKIVVYQYLLGREGQTVDAKQMQKNITHTLKGMYAIFDAYMRRTTKCGVNMHHYMMEKMMIRLHYLYTMALLLHYLDKKTITNLDDYIKKDINVYQSVNAMVIHSFFPFHYVKWWRQHGRDNLPQWMTYVLGKIWHIRKNKIS